ncbi:hypothetical protein BDZ97DRAFT_1913419 [Flammula alnicola]|nr:hypothetical protein BDZ97DRAFT_1913419 [Flammula alnicola]
MEISNQTQNNPQSLQQNHHTKLNQSPTMSSPKSLKVGIAMYNLRRGSGDSEWYLGHEVRALASLGDLIGVLHIGEITSSFMSPPQVLHPEPYPRFVQEKYYQSSLSIDTLDAFIKQFPRTRSGDDPSELFIWTHESYVIRILNYLSARGAMRLPCKPIKMYPNSKPRIAALKALPKVEGQVNVLPFAD